MEWVYLDILTAACFWGLSKQQKRKTVWPLLHSSQNVKIGVTGQEEVVSYRIKNVSFMVWNLEDEWAGATKDPGSFQGSGLKATARPASTEPPWRKCGLFVMFRTLGIDWGEAVVKARRGPCQRTSCDSEFQGRSLAPENHSKLTDHEACPQPRSSCF